MGATKKKGNGSKDPEAPYYQNPTPGKPGWNISKKNKPKGTPGVVDESAAKNIS